VDLYLDDCLDSDLLNALLTNAGHRVVTPRAAGTLGQSDDDHLEYASQHGLVLITRNPDDFRDRHDLWQAQGRAHSGIWLVCLDNIKGKDMQPPAPLETSLRQVSPSSTRFIPSTIGANR
jgi:hypothetical protein